MADIYDQVLANLKGDPRSNAELSKECGVPSETIRDVRAERVSPRIDTVRKLASLYEASRPKSRALGGSAGPDGKQSEVVE